MQYIAKPVIVSAFQIIEIRGYTDTRNVQLTLEDERHVEALNDMTVRITPKVGDYWITNADGYEHLMSKAKFAEHYEALTEEAEPSSYQAAVDETADALINVSLLDPKEVAALLKSSQRQNDDATNSNLRAEDLGENPKPYEGEEKRIQDKTVRAEVIKDAIKQGKITNGKQ